MAKNYGSFVKDDNNESIVTGNGIQTFDSTASPKNSPLAITTGTTTLAVPSNAAEVVFNSSVALRISEVSNLATYFVIGASTTIAIPVGRLDNIYVAGDSSSGTLQFYFITI